MCRRDRPETCRGTPTKLVEVDYDKWTIPAWQTNKLGGDGMVLSAFGDTDGDGDVDMVGLVCYSKVEGGSYCSAKLIFYENVAGSVPGTPPSWEARASDYEKGNLAGIVPPGFSRLNAGQGPYPGFGFHFASTAFLLLVDHDKDGDLDLVVQGALTVNRLFPSIARANSVSFYKNIGNPTHAEWVPAVSPFGTLDKCGEDGCEIALTFADMDADGDLDAVRGEPLSKYVSYFENVGTDKSPSYENRGLIYESSFFQSSVVLRDLDNDGDFDLLIGAGSTIYIIENTGCRTKPAWTKKSSFTWMGLEPSSAKFGVYGLVQQMIDLDNDGLDELVYRFDDGMIFFQRKKVGGANGFVARTEWALKDEKFPGNSQGYYAAPVGVDLNGDGHQDLVVGTFMDGLKYFERKKDIGTSGVEYAARADLKTKSGSVIKAGSSKWGSSTYTMNKPTFLDVDQDNDYDLILAVRDDGIWYYENDGISPTTPNFVRQTSWELFDPIPKDCKRCMVTTGHFDGEALLDVSIGNSMYQHRWWSPTFERKTAWESGNGLPNLQQADLFGGLKRITFGDVDQDGDDDAIVGIQDGTLEYYERVTPLIPPKWEHQAEWSLSGVDVGDHAYPALVDYDSDGDLDLIVGNKAGKLLLFEQGICKASCTDTGSCNIGTEYMPTCTCSFEGATANRSCNSCDGGYHFVPSDLTSVNSVDGSDAGTCSSCGPGNFGKFLETRKSKDDTCEACPSGYYQGGIASAICEECPKGWYQNGEEFKYCFSCLPGEFQDVIGQSECKKCSDGTASNKTRRETACDACSEGQTAPPGSTECSACLAGRYEAVIDGLQGCADCSVGQYTDTSKATSCTKCLAGSSQSKEGKTFCALCLPGEYQNEEGATSCHECLENTASNDPGRNISCVMCPAGRNSSQGSTKCSSCGNGKFKVDSNELTFICQKCVPGQFVMGTNKVKCDDCSPGYFASTTGASACKPCGKGTYNSETGASNVNQCQACTQGTYSSATGVTNITDCNVCAAGKKNKNEGSMSSSACVDCDSGKASATAGSFECATCASGRNSSQGSTKCSSCGNGKIRVGSDELTFICQECDPGKFMTGTNKVECDNCFPGYFASMTGANTCDSCGKGKYNSENGASNVNQCKDCPKGKYSSVSAVASEKDCNDCAAGKKNEKNGSIKSSDCVDCEANTKAEKEGSTECQTCEDGKHSDQGSAKCTMCDAGKASFGVVGACVPCPLRYFRNGADQNATQCKLCELGEETTVIGSSACSKCEVGKYGSVRGICMLCEDGQFQDGKGESKCKKCDSEKPISNAKRTSCERPEWAVVADCKAGTQYLDDTSADKFEWECTNCPPGADCSGTRHWKQVMPLPGHHRLTFDSRSFGKCPFEDACNLSFFGGCAPGHDSNASELCSQCLGPTPEAPNGYAAQSRGEACEPCPNEEDTGALFFGAIMLAVLLFAFLVWDNLGGANDMIPAAEAAAANSDSDSNSDSDARAATANTTTKMPFHSIVIRIVSSYLQIAGMLLQFDLHLPPSVRTLVVMEGSTSSLRYVFFSSPQFLPVW